MVPCIPFQIQAVLPEVVRSLPQDCCPLALLCLACDTLLWSQQPVGIGLTLCHMCCSQSNGSFYCMEVSVFLFGNAMQQLRAANMIRLAKFQF